MPLLTLKDSDGAFEAQLPGSLRRLRLGDLHPSMDSAGRYFLGHVLLNFPTTILGNGQMLFKAVLAEPVTGTSPPKTSAINTVFFGAVAEECGMFIRQGDLLAITGFKCSESPSASKDGRHPFQMELQEENAPTVYVYVKAQTTTFMLTEPSVPKPGYAYTPLSKLQVGTIVNVFAVVKHFKAPFRTKGTDYCSAVTIVDPSDVKLTCNIFNGNCDALPKISKIGDIVRFHRLKIQEYKTEKQGTPGAGFSSVTFDGTVGAAVMPRTSSKSFSFSYEDSTTVTALRRWASAHLPPPPSPVTLSTVQPMAYFDLTCQLVGKAEVDCCTFLLKVWDGTKCLHPHTKVRVETGALVGDEGFIYKLRNLTVDVLVFDNHARTAESLMVGCFIRINSLHVKSQTSNISEEVETPCLDFLLHGGTGYGRGITILPESNSDVLELQRTLDLKLLDLDDHMNIEEAPSCGLDGTAMEPTHKELVPMSKDPVSLPSVSLPRCQQSSATVITAHHHMNTTSLKDIQNMKAPQKYRIRAQLMEFEPQRINESIKLYCSNCQSLQDVPDEEELDMILQNRAATAVKPGLLNLALCRSSTVKRENQDGSPVVLYFLKCGRWETPQDRLLMIEGGTMQEIYQLSEKFHSVVPVTTEGKHLSFPDFSAPFLIQGKRCYYGCRRCSSLKSIQDRYVLTEKDSLDPDVISRALGIVLLQCVLVMKLTFNDGTDLLDAYLWDTSEQFFHISAAEVLSNDAVREKLQGIMKKLCPPEAKLEDHPWLECCIKSYNVKDEINSTICYQIFDTVVVEDA
ncbi:protection of telomeres protein 1 [Ambystoma mexicanum]|uniref:protection of telomeres protein 1 n=1 Tax=Ambystoma mexicanum TaxID=8296 RepID=UPI0037E838B7